MFLTTHKAKACTSGEHPNGKLPYCTHQLGRTPFPRIIVKGLTLITHLHNLMQISDDEIKSANLRLTAIEHKLQQS